MILGAVMEAVTMMVALSKPVHIRCSQLEICPILVFKSFGCNMSMAANLLVLKTGLVPGLSLSKTSSIPYFYLAGSANFCASCLAVT